MLVLRVMVAVPVPFSAMILRSRLTVKLGLSLSVIPKVVVTVFSVRGVVVPS